MKIINFFKNCFSEKFEIIFLDPPFKKVFIIEELKIN